MAIKTLFLSRKNLAERWAINIRGVDALWRKQLIPQPIRIGGSLRWNLEAIEAFEEQANQKQESN